MSEGLSVRRILSAAQMLFIKISQTVFKGELKLLQLFVLTLPHWLWLPLLLLRELFRLCAQTRECLIHPELPPWSRNKSPTSILHGVQAPHFQLCWSTHCWEPSEGEEPLFTDVLHLLPPPKAPPAPEVELLALLHLLTPIFRWGVAD